MTVPNTPQGNVGGIIGNMLGGASGSLGGTNALQSSIDSLTNAVNSLSQQISSANFGGGGLGNGNSTRQQNRSGNTQPFPRMQNPFQPNQQQPGIGGGGPGGRGNITQPKTFGSRYGATTAAGMMLGAITQFGQQQMNPLLTLNSYATNAQMMLGGGNASSMNMIYNLAGATPNRLNTIALSQQDAFNMMPTMNQMAGSINSMSTPLGRAGWGATAAMGLTNPGLGATNSANLASALYSPVFSLNMMRMGYTPIRSMSPNGKPLNAGQAAQSIIQRLGLAGMNAKNFYGNLTNPVTQQNLSALFGPSGISNSQAMNYLTGYENLFRHGYSATSATNLFQQAMSGNHSQSMAALAKLNKAGVSVTASDLQAMKNNQATLTGRSSTYAGGFNSAIQQSTALLGEFNTALTTFLKDTGLGSVAGYAGGWSGILSGTSHGVGMGLGMGGAMMGMKLLGRAGGGAGASALGSLLGGAGTAEGIAALSGLATTLAAVATPLAAAAAAWIALGNAGGWLKSMGIKNVGGLGSSQVNQENMLKQALKSGNMSASHQAHVQHVLAQLGAGQSFSNSYIQHLASPGGGAAPTTTQGRTSGNTMQGGISGSAKKAVSAAESQVGVPYVWGDEIPGVGFDCSGLVQWAYKQAGVSLPRTSQAMWSALKNRRVPLNKVQEGDLLFAAGSDGTATSPGHVAMMVGNGKLIQAPYSGQKVQIDPYNPGAWAFAARPSGSGSFIAGSTASAVSSTGSPSSSVAGLAGNMGASPATNMYGSAEEVNLINGYTGGAGGFSLVGVGGNGTSGSANTNTGAKSSKGSYGSPGNTANITGGGSISANKKLMQQMAQAMYGWGPSNAKQWAALNTLEMHEAGYNNLAQNPNSTAYGIGQFLNSTWAGFGPKTSDPKLQIKYMLEYIKGKYGSPVNAWAQYYNHPNGQGWYGAGGSPGDGLSIVGDRGPELMLKSGNQTHIFSNSQTMSLINRIKGNVPQNPWKTDITSGGSTASSSRAIHVNFAQGAININGMNTSQTSQSIASKAGREVARQIVKHINDEAVFQAIRNGEKL